MPATLVEEVLESENSNDPLQNAVQEPQVTPSATDPAPSGDALNGEDVPEKYRGKSARELLDIALNQESLIGRHSQELGELRQQNGTLRGLVDKSLSLRNTGDIGRTELTESDLKDEDFLTTPMDATKRTVQNETQALQAEVKSLQAQARSIQFERRYPSAAQDVNDPAFVEFVQGSQTRQTLAGRAFSDISDIDYDAAEELWSLYEDYKAFKPAAAPATEPAAEAETPAATESATASTPPKEAPQLVQGSGSSTTATAASGKPIYSQAALNELMETNPEAYWRDSTQRKLREAYDEGRVIDDV